MDATRVPPNSAQDKKFWEQETQEMTSSLLQHDLTITSDMNVIRFQKRITGALSVLMDYPTRVPYPEFEKLSREEQPMVTQFYTLMRTTNLQVLVDVVMQATLSHVKHTLGMEQPTFEDLLAMPLPTDADKKLWLVYFDGTERRDIIEIQEGAHESGTIVRRGKYVGSSVDNRGGGVRLAKHERAAVSKQSSEKKQRHHEELCRPGCKANLRVLAIFHHNVVEKPYIGLLETLFVALLGTFVRRERPRTHNPACCYELYDEMRERSDMPVIEGDGLNGALPIHQGMTAIKHADQTFYCTVCGQELRPYSKARNACRLVDRGNPLGSRRCGPCHTAFSKDGKERTPGPDGKFRSSGGMRKQHQAWVAEGNADVCGNAACAALRQPGANFSGWMENARCGDCYAYLSYYKQSENSIAGVQERQPSEKELLARKHIWTVEEDELLKAQCELGMVYGTIARDYFPDMPAQTLRIRMGILKASRKLSRQTTKPKAPPWNDEEVKLLQDAVENKTKPKSIEHLLPQRSISAIHVKMGELRKKAQKETEFDSLGV